jgi:hypothetical protein
MPGATRPIKARRTLADPPDRRVPEVPLDKLTPTEIRRFFREDVTDPRVRPVDLQFQRWASNPGSTVIAPGLAQMRFLAGRNGALAPLSDRDLYIVDVAVKRAPRWARDIVLMWYRSERSTREIALSLGLPRHQAVPELRTTSLCFFLGHFTAMGMQLYLPPS